MNINRTLLAITLVVSLGVVATQAEDAKDEKGFRSIFDGKSLRGWEGRDGLWTVEDGAITGRNPADKPIKGNTFLIWRGGELKDFELRLKFRLPSEKGNSGIQFRSKDHGNFVVGGYQADIDAPPHGYMGILYEERGRGILANRSHKVVIDSDGKKNTVGETLDNAKFLKKLDAKKWNDYVITVKGNHIVQKINGFTTVEVTDNQSEKAAKSGILALQLHAGPPMTIQFKDIRIKQD